MTPIRQIVHMAPSDARRGIKKKMSTHPSKHQLPPCGASTHPEIGAKCWIPWQAPGASYGRPFQTLETFPNGAGRRQESPENFTPASGLRDRSHGLEAIELPERILRIPASLMVDWDPWSIRRQ